MYKHYLITVVVLDVIHSAKPSPYLVYLQTTHIDKQLSYLFGLTLQKEIATL
jgi:hypothetical protein